MKAKTMLGVVLLTLGAAAALSGCGKAEHASKKEHASTKAHEAVTFMAPYMDTDRFIEAVHAKYPEVNIEIIPYSGDNTTTYLQNMMAAGDLPDVCTMTVYDPYVDDFSAQLLDLSGYEFTDRYVESRLRDVADEGAIYMLPSAYSFLASSTISACWRSTAGHGRTLLRSSKSLLRRRRKRGCSSVKHRSSIRAMAFSICAISRMPTSSAHSMDGSGRRII